MNSDEYLNEDGLYTSFYEYAEDLDRRCRMYRHKGHKEVPKKRKFINSNWDDRHPIIKALYILNDLL